MCQMSGIDFPTWLQNQLDNKNWRVKDLARHSHISDAAVSRVLSGQRNADTDTLLAFANALNISPIVMFRQAGKLPENNGADVKLDDWEFLLKQMSPEDEAELRQIAELKIERRKKELSLKSLKPKKVG